MNLNELYQSLIQNKNIKNRDNSDLFISDDNVSELIDEFMPEGTFNCRKLDCNNKNCKSRCNYLYWYDHGQITKKLMESLAKQIDADEEVYGKTGLIHDLDYLKFPHDRKNKDKENQHPIPLVKKMKEKGIHPEICLAILAHSPHIQRSIDISSSRLSLSLIACEELATLLSVENNEKYYTKLSNEAKNLVEISQIQPEYLIDLTIDTPRVLGSPSKLINDPLSKVLRF